MLARLGRKIIVGGDVAVWFGELDEPHTEGQLRVLALDPELVWLGRQLGGVPASSCASWQTP